MSIKTKTLSVFLSVATAAVLIMPVAASAYTWSTNLKQGSTGADVMELQKFLNTDTATKVASSGAGSPGSETSYFGVLTRAAVIKFQEKYIADILTPLGLTSGTGYFYAASRAKANTLSGGVVITPPGTPPVVPIGTGLTVTAGVQPAASIAPYSAARIPFTVVNFTASSDGDVTVTSLVVERTGLAADAVLSGIILLDESGIQIGLEKTLNSVHQTTLTESFVVKAGQTRTMTIAGNRAAQGSHGGEIAYLSLVAVNTAATVNGTLPISGTGQTINETLAIGSVTMARGPLDPAASSTAKEIGTTGYTFSSVKVTAGSAEKVRLTSIRWNQSGSAATGDLANIKSYIDGVAYDTVVSSDGKYFTTSFGTGIIIDKGFSKEISIKGDIIGGSARTIQFDIYKQTDLALKGETYGYGITPPVSSSVSGFHAVNPWYYAFSVTVSSGTMNVSKATSVAAQNIAINLADQPLGGFIVDVKGEAISAAAMTFRMSKWWGGNAVGTYAAGSYTSDITNISIYDENGKVVAGPVDITTTSPNVAFTDTVTFPIGVHTYTLKGKLTTDYLSNDLVIASTTPASDWTTVKGAVTGNTITPSGGTITGSTMTVKSGALGVTVSTIPLTQTVIAGASQFTFANDVLDAGNSGEDLSMNALPTSYSVGGGGTVSHLSSCNIYDGSIVLTTGSNIKNPTAVSSSTSFTFDVPLTILKGGSKTLALKCDIAGNATAGGSFAWGCDTTTCGDNYSATGKVSGQSVTPSVTVSTGQYMTIAAAGTYTVADDSTVGYTIISAGTTGVTLLKLKFTATTEDIDIQKVGLELQNVAATSTALDLVGNKVTLYDSANPTVAIATAEFTGTGGTARLATSTALNTGAFRIPAGASKTLLVKGDIGAINYTQGPLQISGHWLQMSYDGASSGSGAANYGKGVQSGSTVAGPVISDIYNSSGGVRIMKGYPTFAKIDLSTTERTLQTGSEKALYKWKVTANASDVYLYKFTFYVGSSTLQATTTSFGVYAYSDSAYSLADSTFSSDGLLNYGSCSNGLNSAKSLGAQAVYPGGIVEVYMDKGATAVCNVATTTYKIPSGETRWFILKATISNVETSSSVTENISTYLFGDAAFPVFSGTVYPEGLMGAAKRPITGAATGGVESVTDNDFIWSPNSTSSTNAPGDLDFTNGYGLTGLPTTNMAQEILTSAN